MVTREGDIGGLLAVVMTLLPSAASSGDGKPQCHRRSIIRQARHRSPPSPISRAFLALVVTSGSSSSSPTWTSSPLRLLSLPRNQFRAVIAPVDVEIEAAGPRLPPRLQQLLGLLRTTWSQSVDRVGALLLEAFNAAIVNGGRKGGIIIQRFHEAINFSPDPT
ncbi:uncharacterized protein LOC127741574 [Arachis duranensis]|uniref:Uncharacterized protein LOC127741574 n=1 Tax=Arachis duranensis TaxID=130453 RepID=A0A9C6TGQ9_ARADU|nr:uncharacterized protein LOC127741574 [Arachis duranensis]